MSFGFRRVAPGEAFPATSEISSGPEPLSHAALVAALDAIKRGAEPAAWPDGDTGAALKALKAELDRRARVDLDAIVAFATEAAATGTGVGWVTHDVRQVAESTATISGAVEELASSISELSSMSRSGANDAVAAREETGCCLDEMRQASGSMEAIRDRVGAIGSRIAVLEDAVRQIAEMAGAIEAISSQTNLLALNATIEAARAGEAGRGFAVVANEVKSLSGQTARATDQIRARIATLMEQTDQIKRATAESAEAVASGEATIRATGVKVEAVGQHVSVITANMNALADVLGQQRAATNEISENVARIASTAAKTRGEIDVALVKLVAAEDAALSGVDAAASRNIAGYEAARVLADASVTRRRLASILIGISPATSFDPESFGSRLDKAADCPPDLVRLRDQIRRDAARLIAQVSAQDWAAASASFERAEASFDSMHTIARRA